MPGRCSGPTTIGNFRGPVEVWFPGALSLCRCFDVPCVHCCPNGLRCKTLLFSLLDILRLQNVFIFIESKLEIVMDPRGLSCGQGVWFRRGSDAIRVRYGRGTGAVRARYGSGAGAVRARYGRGTEAIHRRILCLRSSYV